MSVNDDSHDMPEQGLQWVRDMIEAQVRWEAHDCEFVVRTPASSFVRWVMEWWGRAIYILYLKPTIRRPTADSTSYYLEFAQDCIDGEPGEYPPLALRLDIVGIDHEQSYVGCHWYCSDYLPDFGRYCELVSVALSLFGGRTVRLPEWGPEINLDLSAFSDEEGVTRSSASKPSTRGPSHETRRRAELFKRIKTNHPSYSQARVAREATREAMSRALRGENPQTYTANDVRNAYRAMKWPWERGDEVR